MGSSIQAEVYYGILLEEHEIEHLLDSNPNLKEVWETGDVEKIDHFINGEFMEDIPQRVGGMELLFFPDHHNGDLDLSDLMVVIDREPCGASWYCNAVKIKPPPKKSCKRLEKAWEEFFCSEAKVCGFVIGIDPNAWCGRF